MKRRRSPWIHLFCLWVSILATISIWRGIVLWQERKLLAELDSSLSPTALVILVVLSTACGLGLGLSTVGLWFRKNWGRISARVCIPLYFVIVQTYVWLFIRSGLLWERRWVSLIAAIAAVGISIGILTWRRARQWLGIP